MAVVSMQKVQVVVHQHDVDDFLATMQRFGAMEFEEISNESLVEFSAEAPHAALLPRVQHAIGFLEPYETKRSVWKVLREGSTTDCSEENIIRRLSDTDAVSAIIRDVEAIQVEFAEKSATVRHLEEQHMLLKAWESVSNKLSELDTVTTTSFLVTRTTDEKTTMESVVTAALEEQQIACAVEVVSDASALVTVTKTDATEAEALLVNKNMILVDRPNGSESASVELVAVEEGLAAGKGELGVIHDQAEYAAHTHLKELRIVGELLEWERMRFNTLETSKATDMTVVFAGWLVADRKEIIEADLQTNNIAAAFVEVALGEGEEPPVEIENSGIIKPFEAVTRLYGMPGYTDLDPTLFLAGFFFLFFGLCLTDVGYGATLAVISGGLLFFAKLKDGTRSMMKLLFFIGVSTMLIGALFGGYFGIASDQLPSSLQALQMFDPIGNPLPVFYLALGLGVFQVMVGMMLKVYSDARNSKLTDGLWEQGPWLFLFAVGITYVLGVVEYVSVSTDTLVKLSYVGLGLLVVGAVRKSRGVLEAIMNIGGSLYGSVGFLSDILSYSRLLALGLATTALAFAVNLIAGIVYDSVPYLGPIFAAFVLLIGHVFTLAVNTLGAFIHSARLQFVEFFGKFVAGTGRSFSPLMRSENHVTVTKE